MKTFEDICKMTQPELKKYMKGYLASRKYNVVDEDGFLYAKGEVPVLLVAHMDTVHVKQCEKIYKVNGRMTSPQGIGGDDRCGVFIIMNLVKELKCSVLLCEDEEKGGVGARKFTKAKHVITNDKEQAEEVRYIDHLDVNYMVEFDRKGNNDAVFYSCANEEFIDFVEDATNFKFSTGSFSDISVLMPEAKLSAVNLSCGYHNPHCVTEYVIYDEMMDTVEAAKTLIKEKCDKPFEYIKKTYSYPTSSLSTKNFNGKHSQPFYAGCFVDRYSGDQYYQNLLDDSSLYHDECLANVAKNDKDLELEVTIYGVSLSEETLLATGETKAECWMNMFLENPNLCFNDIVDYTWG
jgi:hypothetical protein